MQISAKGIKNGIETEVIFEYQGNDLMDCMVNNVHVPLPVATLRFDLDKPHRGGFYAEANTPLNAACVLETFFDRGVIVHCSEEILAMSNEDDGEDVIY